MNTDRINKHFIIFTLCFVSIVFCAVVAALSWQGRDIAPSLDKLTYAVLGYLIGLLGRTSSEVPAIPTGTANDPLQAQIVNPPSQPVPTHDTPEPPPESTAGNTMEEEH